MRYGAAKMRYVFADTNVYLHYKQWDDPAWSSLVGEDGFVLVVPATTISELDTRKSDRHSRVRKRARDAVAWLLRQRGKDRPEIQPGIRLLILPTEPQEAFKRHRDLDPHVQDDRFLASVLELRTQHPEGHVAILSEDAAVLLKADQHGIDANQPPAACKLPDTRTEEEKEIADLRSKLDGLLQAQPDLHLTTTSQDLLARISIGPSSHDVTEFVNGLREKERFNRTRNLETARQRESVESYLERFDQYLRDLTDVLLQWSSTIALDLELHNDGAGPGDDVQILLEWDGDVRLVTELSRFPRAPRPPRIHGGLMADLPSLDQIYDPARFIANVFPRDPDIGGPYACARQRCAQYTVKRIHQGLSITLPRLLLGVSSTNGIGGFSMGWRIVAANAPNSKDGEIHVQIGSGRRLEECVELFHESE